MQSFPSDADYDMQVAKAAVNVDPKDSQKATNTFTEDRVSTRRREKEGIGLVCVQLMELEGSMHLIFYRHSEGTPHTAHFM